MYLSSADALTVEKKLMQNFDKQNRKVYLTSCCFSESENINKISRLYRIMLRWHQKHNTFLASTTLRTYEFAFFEYVVCIRVFGIYKPFSTPLLLYKT